MKPAGGARQLLRQPHFGQLLATRFVGQAADGVVQAGLASYFFFSPTHQTTGPQAASAFATLLLPYSIAGPFAGVLLDRWRRRQVLVRANLLRAALGVPVVAVVARGDTGVRLYLTALVVLSVNRFVLAALSAALPHVVPRSRLVSANAVATTGGGAAFAIGGAVGLVLRGALGESAGANAVVIVAGLLGYGVAGVVATSMAADLLGPDHARVPRQLTRALADIVTGVGRGAVHVWQRRAAGVGLLVMAAHRFCYGISTIATLLLYRNFFVRDGILHGGVAGFGEAVFASSAGQICAAFVTPPITRRIGKARWITVLLGLAAVVEVALVLPYRLPAFIVAAFGLGVVAQGVKICVDTIVQERVDDQYRGRVFSLYDIVFNVAFVAAAAVAALALPASGRAPAVVWLIGLGYALTAVAYGWWSGSLSARPEPSG
ncbi:MAG: MFS transporter [Mycobacteriales bacterium]